MLLILIQKINGVSILSTTLLIASVIAYREYLIRFAPLSLKLEDNFIIGSYKN